MKLPFRYLPFREFLQTIVTPPLSRQAIPDGGVDVALRAQAHSDPPGRSGLHHKEARHQLLLPGTDAILKTSSWLGTHRTPKSCTEKDNFGKMISVL